MGNTQHVEKDNKKLKLMMRGGLYVRKNMRATIAQKNGWRKRKD